MQFTKVEPDENYQLIKYQSQKWEIGYRQVMFGYRISAGIKGEQHYRLDYCGGAEELFLRMLFNCVHNILGYLPEELPPHKVEEFFPREYKVRPIYKDALWQHLFIIFNQLRAGVHWDKIPKLELKEIELGEKFDYYLMSNGEPIAYLKATMHKTHWAVDDISVDPQLQQHGYGTLLLQSACQSMWDKIFQNCRIEKCPEDFLHDWFLKMGFEGKGRCFERMAGDFNYGFARQLNWA